MPRSFPSGQRTLSGSTPTASVSPLVYGDLTGSLPSPSVSRMNGTTVPVTTDPDVGKVLTVIARNESNWISPAVIPLLSFYLFVDDGTAVPVPSQTGSIDKPFSTIQAAVTAAGVIGFNVTIFVSPGTYTEYVTIPDMDNLAIIGAGADNTILISPPAPVQSTLTWVSGAGTGLFVHRFLLQDITVTTTHADGTSTAIELNGAANNDVAATGTFLDKGVEFVRVRARTVVPGNPYEACVSLRCLGSATLTQCDFEDSGGLSGGGKTLIQELTNLTVRCGTRMNVLDARFDATFLVPATLRGEYWVTDNTVITGQAFGTQNAVYLNGHPSFNLDESCVVDGQGAAITASVNGTSLTSYFSAAPAIGDWMPVIGLHGTIQKGVQLIFPATAGGVARPIFNGDLGRFKDTFWIERTGASPITTATARQAAFIGTVTSNVQANLDIRGSWFNQANLVSGGTTGTIDRDHHLFLAEPMPLAANVVAISVPFPASITSDYQIVVTPLSGPAADPYITAKGPTVFTVNLAAFPIPAGCDLLLVRFNSP